MIIDVREQDEYDSGHVDGAINIPLSELGSSTTKLDELDKDQQVILYCRSGARAGSAVQLFKSLGFKDVVNGINQQTVEQQYL